LKVILKVFRRLVVILYTVVVAVRLDVILFPFQRLMVTIVFVSEFRDFFFFIFKNLMLYIVLASNIVVKLIYFIK
jgi:hypothetical protein